MRNPNRDLLFVSFVFLRVKQNIPGAWQWPSSYNARAQSEPRISKPPLTQLLFLLSDRRQVEYFECDREASQGLHLHRVLRAEEAVRLPQDPGQQRGSDCERSYIFLLIVRTTAFWTSTEEIPSKAQARLTGSGLLL